MGTAKRARQKAGRQARMEALAAAQKKQRQRKVGIRIAILLVVFVAGAFLLSQVFGSNDTQDATSLNTTTTSVTGESTTSVAATTPNTITTVPGATVTGATPCPAADGSSARTLTFEQAPPTCIDPAKTYTATIDTTEGTIVATLDPAAAPVTVNNFVVLARYHFFDGIYFHRIVTGFVNQAGDPTASGGGGPGYTFADELPADASAYKVGTLAMANSGPDTNGSQFFMVVAEGKLAASYSVFGQITQGLDVMNAINALGSPDSAGTPQRPVQILSVTIGES